MPLGGEIEIVSGNAHVGPPKISITNVLVILSKKGKGPVSETFPGNKVEAAEVEDLETKLKVVIGATTEIDQSTIIARAEARSSAPAAPPMTTAIEPLASSVFPVAKKLPPANR